MVLREASTASIVFHVTGVNEKFAPRIVEVLRFHRAMAEHNTVLYSTWVMVDITKRRLARIPEEMKAKWQDFTCEAR